VFIFDVHPETAGVFIPVVHPETAGVSVHPEAAAAPEPGQPGQLGSKKLMTLRPRGDTYIPVTA
jgi:hypothetical protein